MAKPNETTNDATTATALYRVNYQYVAKDGQLRAGAMVLDTTSAEKAKEEAKAKLASTNFAHPRITNVKAY